MSAFPCDVADCPREGTNELPVRIFDPETRNLAPGTALLCDGDFRAVHEATLRFELGQGQEEGPR